MQINLIQITSILVIMILKLINLKKNKFNLNNKIIQIVKLDLK